MKQKTKSKVFFILSVVCLIITIICICISTKMTDEFNNINWKSDSGEYYRAQVEYEVSGDRTQLNKYEEKRQKVNNLEDKRDTFFIISIIFGGITVISLTTGIVFTVVEKKKK